MARKRVFVPMTPYHLFLILAWDETKKNDIVFIIDQNGSLGVFKDRSDFFGHKCLYFCENKLSKLLSPNFSGLVDCDEIVLFNDSPFIVQALVKRNQRARVTLIEDGSALYNSHCFEWKNSAVILRKVFYPWFEPIKYIGTSSRIDSIVALFPELVNARYSAVKKFSCAENWENLTKKLLSYFYQTTSSSYPGVKYLILPGKFESVELYLEKVGCPGDKTVMAKLHPAASVSISSAEVSILGSSGPAELLPYVLPSLEAVYSSASSVLLTYRFFFPEVACYSLMASKDAAYSAVLIKSGVSGI